MKYRRPRRSRSPFTIRSNSTRAALRRFAHSMKSCWKRSASMMENTLPKVSWGRYAVGQVQEGLQPLPLDVAELLDVHPRIGSGDYGAYGDCDYVDEVCFLVRSILGSSSLEKMDSRGEV